MTLVVTTLDDNDYARTGSTHCLDVIGHRLLGLQLIMLREKGYKMRFQMGKRHIMVMSGMADGRFSSKDYTLEARLQEYTRT